MASKRETHAAGQEARRRIRRDTAAPRGALVRYVKTWMYDERRRGHDTGIDDRTEKTPDQPDQTVKPADDQAGTKRPATDQD